MLSTLIIWHTNVLNCYIPLNKGSQLNTVNHGMISLLPTDTKHYEIHSPVIKLTGIIYILPYYTVCTLHCTNALAICNLKKWTNELNGFKVISSFIQSSVTTVVAIDDEEELVTIEKWGEVGSDMLELECGCRHR